eukprot:jgi/Ulvmu1/8587/UM045_0030.1
MRMVLTLLVLVLGLAPSSSPAADSWPSFVRMTAASATHGASDENLSLEEVSLPASGSGRSLLQSTATPVTTPVQLQNAVASGARHIIVQQHMDLSSLQPTANDFVLGVALNTTFSITGNCATAPGPALSSPTGAALRPLLPWQCLLLTDTSVLTVSNSSLWMDNLYLRLQRSARTPLEPFLLATESESPALYLTGITLQGDGQFKSTGTAGVQSCNGLSAASPVYMQGCTLSHLGGDMKSLYAEDTLSIVNTTIVDNAQFEDADSVLYLFYAGSTAWLRGVTFARNNAPQVIVSYSGGNIYSDTPLQYYSWLDNQYVASLGSPGAGADFLSPQDAFFQTAIAGVPRAPASVPAQATGNADAVTEAPTAAALQQALQNGARHIEVTAHLDLTSLDAAPNPGEMLLGFFADSTRSIRGNCAAAPQLQLEGPPLLPLLPGQCVIVADMDLWHVRFGRLWMHNLYLRHTASVRDDAVALVTSTEPSGQLWLTQMTMQGAGAYADGIGALGLTAGGPTYVEGCRFSHLGGSEQVVYINDATVRIVNSTFSDNTITDDASSIIYTYYSDGTAWLQGSALNNNSVALPLVAGYSSGGFASDVPREFYQTTDNIFKDTTVRPADASAFLNGDERWLKDVQAVFPNVTVTSKAAVEPPATKITPVTTAQELQAALASSARHIELRGHIDLTAFETEEDFLLGSARSGTRTLRGNCSTVVDASQFQLDDGAALRPLAEGQCLIVSDGDMLQISQGRLWIDNLYVRVQRTDRNTAPTLLSIATAGGQLWLTRSTLQGDGSIETFQGSTGLATGTAGKVYAQGVLFADLGGSESPVFVQSNARFVDCTFMENSVTGINDGIVLVSGLYAEAWLQACQLLNNTATFELVESSGTIYSDGTQKVYSSADTAEVQPPSTPEDRNTFLTLEDDFVTEASGEAGQLLQLQPAAPAAPGAPVAAPTLTVTDTEPTAAAVPGAAADPAVDDTAGTSGNGGGDGGDATAIANSNVNTNANNNVTVNVPTSASDTNWAAIGGGVAAVVIILLLIACIACLFVTRRRRRERGGNTGGHGTGSGYGTGGVYTGKPGELPSMDTPGPSKRGHSDDFSNPAALHIVAGPPGVARTGGDMASGYSVGPGLPGGSMHGPTASTAGGQGALRAPERPGASQHGPTASTIPQRSGSMAGGTNIVNPVPAYDGSASMPPVFPGAAPCQASQGRRQNGSAQAHTGLTTTVASDVTSAGARSNYTTSVATATSVYNTSTSAGETTVAQQKERLTTELDHMRQHNELFLGQFAVLPWTERREGGQGVVQFMRSARTEEAVAVKFFLSRKAFDAELELYKVDVLRSMMPAIRLDLSNADAAERNSRSYPWPPCIVIEKGESLQEWKAKTQPAFSTIVDALCLIAERLAQLHGSGWVHRDLKPGNILRLPGQHSWTLMDFGCAARSAASVPIAVSPSYAPPEVALALERKDNNITADAAADMWALGLMAFELLTGQPVFPPIVSTRESIWAKLCGREVLPWEDGAPQQAEKLAQLRGLKRAILQCLQRHPSQRPTAEQVLTQWRTLFDSRTAAGQPMI